MGTTFTGAYDDHTCIDEIHEICDKYYEVKEGEKARTCWIHQDGALGGNIAPFFDEIYNSDSPLKAELEKELKTDYLNQVVPRVGFNLTKKPEGVMSINTSFYKFFGAPYPTGVFMTQNKYLRKANTP